MAFWNGTEWIRDRTTRPVTPRPRTKTDWLATAAALLMIAVFMVPLTSTDAADQVVTLSPASGVGRGRLPGVGLGLSRQLARHRDLWWQASEHRQCPHLNRRHLLAAELGPGRVAGVLSRHDLRQRIKGRWTAGADRLVRSDDVHRDWRGRNTEPYTGADHRGDAHAAADGHGESYAEANDPAHSGSDARSNAGDDTRTHAGPGGQCATHPVRPGKSKRRACVTGRLYQRRTHQHAQQLVQRAERPVMDDGLGGRPRAAGLCPR